MKKFFRFLLPALALAALVPACRTTEETPTPSTVKTVRFRAAATDETRSAFAAPENGVYRTYWTQNDEALLLSLNYGKAVSSAITVSADGATASFESAFDASETAAPYTFYAVSPASAARAISPSRKAWSVNIAAEQTPLPASVDEAAQLLVATSAATTILPDEVDLHFAHLTAYGRIALKNLSLGEATVSKVDLVFGTPVVGEWYWAEDGTLTSNGASHTITLNTDAAGDLWFACAPVDVSEQTLKLVLYTDQGVMSKEITFPAGRSFSSGKVARLSVDMDGIEPDTAADTFVLVQNVAELGVGDEVLIVDAAGSYALGAQNDNGTPHRDRVAVTVQDGKITDPGQATVLTLAKGSGTGTWAFRTGGAYLAAMSSGNAMTESSSLDAYSSWTISITGSVATVCAQNGEARYVRYNASAPRFSCYKTTASNMKEVSIYKKGASSGIVTDDPLAEESAYGCYFTGAQRTYVKGSDQILRTTATDGTLEFALLNAAAKEQLVVTGFDPSSAKGQVVQVHVSYQKGLQTILEGTYKLTVVREDGPRVWLGDGYGQGLIIKK